MSSFLKELSGSMMIKSQKIKTWERERDIYILYIHTLSHYTYTCIYAYLLYSVDSL